jgi:anti-anti-sigma factor
MEITRTAADGCMELTITGRLDGYWADHLDAGLTETVREGHHRLRLNLSGVTFISSAGIAVLVKFYKRLTAIKGGLAISSASKPVRTVLDITRLSALLIDETPAAAPETFMGRLLVRNGLMLQVFDLAPGARLVCRTHGHEGTLGAADAPQGTTLACPASRFAFGIGAFGATDAECRDRFGEFVAVAGAAGYLPGDGTGVPDYLVASDAEAPEVRALRAVACDGAFAQQFRFDVKPPGTVVALNELAAAGIDMAGGAVGMVMVAETSGLVGASLRESPAVARTSEFFAFPAVRGRLTFTAERAFARTLTLVTGVAQRKGGPLTGNHVRPLDARGELEGHFHAAAFPFYPFKKGRIELKDTVRALFDAGGLMALLHLLHDDREIVGVGDSEFTRGACWIAPLDVGAQLA